MTMKNKIDITVIISTRGRYHTTLPLCLMSILNQTHSPIEVILVDDNDIKEFYDISINKEILKLFKLKNIDFSYFYGESKGQVYAQKIGIDNSKTDWIFRTDDNNILESDVLETLKNSISFNVGAVSCLILNNIGDSQRKLEYKLDVYNEIKNIYSIFNIQMCHKQDKILKKVEHIYSNYLFKKDIIESDITLDFSPAGHREDTVFTYEIYRKGYDLVINPNCIIYHLNDKKGGNRIYQDEQIYINEKRFIQRMKDWGVIPNKLKIEEDKNLIFTMYEDIKYQILIK